MFDVIVLLWLISLVAFIAGIIKPSLFYFIFRNKPSRKATALYLGGASFIILSLGVFFSEPNNKTASTQKSVSREIPPATVSPSPAKAQQPLSALYSRAYYEDVGRVENLWYLYTGTDKSERFIEKVTRDIKAKNCKKECNVSLYDDKRAFELDRQYNQIRDMEEQNEWKQKNYIYVADHLVGYLSFDAGELSYYPYKDFYYRQLRGE